MPSSDLVPFLTLKIKILKLHSVYILLETNHALFKPQKNNFPIFEDNPAIKIDFDKMIMQKIPKTV